MSGLDGGGLSAEECEALDVMGMFPTPAGLANPAAWERETEGRLSATVERIVAARVAAAEQQWERRYAREESRAEAAEQRAERVTAAVEALADEYQQALAAGPTRSSDERRMAEQVVADLRAALADPTPRQYDDAGPALRAMVERAERDAEVAARVLREFRGWVTAECPHEPDEHPEGCCDVCDWTFTIEGELDDRAATLEGGES